jgi:hypothetical protein
MVQAALNLLEPLASEFLSENLESLGVLPATRELIERTTTPTASVDVSRHRGVPLMLRQGRLLGAPTSGELDAHQGPTGVIVVFGLGMGHTVRSLRAITDAEILVYEPDPGVVRAALEFGPIGFSGVTIVCTLPEVAQCWSMLARGTSAAVLVRTPGYAEAFPDEDRELCRVVEQQVQSTSMNNVTLRKRSREWIRHVLTNIGALLEVPLFQALEGKYAGVPVFIVGAGPSLGKNGALLAEAARKGIVIAVNSSGKALASYGVEPQVLACIESIDLSHLIKDLPYIDRVVRAFSLSGHPATLATGRGPLLPVYEALPQISVPLNALTGQAGLPVCGSVSTVAFSLAHRLGGSPIVLVGQDLAYTDGRAYAPGSVFEQSRATPSADGTHVALDWCATVRDTHDRAGTAIHSREPLISILAWGGKGAVSSTPSFTAVRTWFEGAASILARECPNVRLVNATEGGARIARFEEATLADVLRDLPERNITAASIARDAAAHGAMSRARLRAFFSEQIDGISEVHSAASRLGRLAEAAGRAIQQDRPRRVNRAFSALSRAEEELRGAVMQAPFVDAWAYAGVGEAMGAPESGVRNEGASEEARAAIGKERELARLIRGAAEELSAELERVRRGLGDA